MRPSTFTIFFLLFSLSFLSGCATHKSSNFLKDATPSISESLANDSLMIMKSAYPPGQTKITLRDGISLSNKKNQDDLFGSILITKMREAGYAIEDTYIKSQTARETLGTVKIGSDTRLFYYVLDNITPERTSNKDSQGVSNIIRVTLYVGPTTLSRGYVLSGNGVVPIGYWTRGFLDREGK